MSQKIKCPHCEKEFPMEDGLFSHLKDLETKARERVEKEQGQKLKKNIEQLKILEDTKKELELSNKQKEEQIKSINEDKEKEINQAVKTAVDTKVKNLDKENKEHYESLYETKLKEQKENLGEQNSEKQKLWELKEKRLIATIEDLQKKATQGTTVDQGSSVLPVCFFSSSPVSSVLVFSLFNFINSLASSSLNIDILFSFNKFIILSTFSGILNFFGIPFSTILAV